MLKNITILLSTSQVILASSDLFYIRSMNLRWSIAQNLEIHWWDWYLSGKKPEAYLEWKRQYWLDFFQRFNIPAAPQGKLLEIGCGPAGAFLILPKENLTILDPLLPLYRRKHPQIAAAHTQGLESIELPVEQWSPRHAYDHIYCFNVINHTAHLELCSDKLVAAMRKGSRLYLSVDCHRSKLLKLLFRALPGDVLHPQQLCAGDYIDLFRLKGLHLLHTVLIRREPIFDYQLFIFEK